MRFRRRGRPVYGIPDKPLWYTLLWPAVFVPFAAFAAFSFGLERRWGLCVWWILLSSLYVWLTIINWRRTPYGRYRTAAKDRRGASADDSTGAAEAAAVAAVAAFLASVPHQGTGAPARRWHGLPVEEDGMPILATRKAGLGMVGDGDKLAFTSVVVKQTFGIFEEASCEVVEALSRPGSWWRLFGDKRHRTDPHKPGPVSNVLMRRHIPDPKCVCGFYAVPADKEAHFGYSGLTLNVELTGRVMVCETGYRAQQQTVLGVVLDCEVCHDPRGVLVGSTMSAAKHPTVVCRCMTAHDLALRTVLMTPGGVDWLGYNGSLAIVNDSKGYREYQAKQAQRALDSGVVRMLSLEEISEEMGVPFTPKRG